MELTDRQISIIKIAKDVQREKPMRELGPDANLSAYVASLLLQSNLDARVLSHDDYMKFLNSRELPSPLCTFLTRDAGASIESLARDLSSAGYSSDELADFCLHYNPGEDGSAGVRDGGTTPESIRRLALAILAPTSDESLADLWCGNGALLGEAVEIANGISVWGTGIPQSEICVAQARLDLLSANGDASYDVPFHKIRLNAFDKVFVRPPFSMRLSDLATGVSGFIETIAKGIDPMGRPTSASWAFARLAYDSLNDGGTGVAVLPNGATFNGGDESARRYFVSNGMVRAAVALPEKLFPYTSIGCTLLILGKNEGPIRFVDATDLADEGRRWSTLSDEAIKEILDRLETDSESSRLVDRDELAAKDFSLYADRYLGYAPVLVNPAKIGKVSVSIERGALIPARELDAMTTEEDTGISYLRLADIEDGTITHKLPNLISIDEKLEKQCLRTGDLLLSKTGAPFKVAVADVPDGRTILANGNLYIIRLDPQLIDPYFLAAFLASEDGKRSLEQLTVGTVIPNLSLRNLKQLEVPVPPMDKQNEVAERYRGRLDEVAVLKIKVDRARSGIREAYAEVMGR